MSPPLPPLLLVAMKLLKRLQTGKERSPARQPDFSADEFIRLWHVMVSEEGKDALDRLLTGMTRQHVC
jgi:hypothetical protein